MTAIESKCVMQFIIFLSVVLVLCIAIQIALGVGLTYVSTTVAAQLNTYASTITFLHVQNVLCKLVDKLRTLSSLQLLLLFRWKTTLETICSTRRITTQTTMMSDTCGTTCNTRFEGDEFNALHTGHVFLGLYSLLFDCVS